MKEANTIFSKTPHPKGGYLRRPLLQGRNGKGDIAGRIAGEYIPKDAELGIGEDGQVYVWHEEDE